MAAITPASATDVATVKGTATFQGQPLSGDLSQRDGVLILHGAEKAREPGGKATIDQREGRFIPRVIAVAAGTTVTFPNNDIVHHNVRSRSSVQRFDLGLYPPGEARSVTLENAGVIEIRCGAHRDMEAYVVVSDSPYFALASEDGSYQIDGVPPGSYDAELWHPDAAPVRKPINVRPGIPVSTINLDLRERRNDR
jgi:plastocyanin